MNTEQQNEEYKREVSKEIVKTLRAEGYSISNGKILAGGGGGGASRHFLGTGLSR